MLFIGMHSGVNQTCTIYAENESGKMIQLFLELLYSFAVDKISLCL